MTVADRGKGPLGPFALCVQRPVWIGGEPSYDKAKSDVVWSGNGPYEVQVHARRDGFIIFEFDKSPTYQGGQIPSHIPKAGKPVPKSVTDASIARDALAYKRFDYMNAFLAALYSGWSTVQLTAMPVQPPIDPTNYFAADAEGGTWRLYKSEFVATNNPASRQLLRCDTVAHAIELVARCKVAFGDDSIELLKLIYTACHQYALHQFSSAHLIAWSVIERQVSAMWLALLRDVERGGHTIINQVRRKMFEDGRDYTVSVVTQILSLSGRIDDVLLSRLDEARRKRNAFAHNLEPVGADDAGKAIRTATDVMSKLVGVKITSQLSMLFIDFDWQPSSTAHLT